MNIWMWLIIGFLTGLVVAAIVNLIVKGGSSKETEQVQNDKTAQLAKSEVKIAVLEDKLRQAEADQLAIRTNLDADYKEQLDATEAIYQAQLTILESEKSELAAALSEAQMGRELIQEEYDLEEGIIEADPVTVESIADEDNGHLEDLIVVNNSEEKVDEILVSETEEEIDSLGSAAASGALIAAAIIVGDEEDTDLGRANDLFVAEEESQIESLATEEISMETDSDVEEIDYAGAYDDELEAALDLGEEESANNDIEEFADEAAAEGSTTTLGDPIAYSAEETAILPRPDNQETSAEEQGIDEQVPVEHNVEITTAAAAIIADVHDREIVTDDTSMVDELEDVVEPLELDASTTSEDFDQVTETVDGSGWGENDEVFIGAEAQEGKAGDGDNQADHFAVDDESSENSRLGAAGMVVVGAAAVSVLTEDGSDEDKPDESDYLAEDENGAVLSDEEKPGEKSGEKVEDDIHLHDEEPVDSGIKGEVVSAIPDWPEDTSVWRGEYFNNMKLDGEPVLVREDAVIDFDWGYGSPSPEINVDDFSIRWTRKADLPPGLYRFTVTSDDGVRLWVNERLVISAWYDHSQMTFRREMALPGGPVNLRLEYYEKDMMALIECSWERIG